jgi:hypothetical protein
MKNYIPLNFILLLFSIMLLACNCKKDDEVTLPPNPNEQELITTVKLVMVDQSNNTIVREAAFFEDPNGTPGSNITIDTVRLDANEVYDVSVYLLDQSKNPVDTISKEVEEEGNEHQFFYGFTDLANAVSGNLTAAYIAGDVDSHGVPIGLTPEFTTTSAIVGKLTVTLKHQPGVKPTTGQGDKNLGDTDVEVVFPVKIQ